MFLLLETLLVLEFYIRFGRKWINLWQPKGTLLLFKGNTFLCVCVMIEERRHEPHAFLYSFSSMKPPPCSSLLFPIDHACLGSFRLQEPTHVGPENPGHNLLLASVTTVTCGPGCIMLRANTRSATRVVSV